MSNGSIFFIALKLSIRIHTNFTSKEIQVEPIPENFHMIELDTGDHQLSHYKSTQSVIRDPRSDVS